jgi:lambda repressor-like predicted transcriptional regulator
MGMATSSRTSTSNKETHRMKNPIPKKRISDGDMSRSPAVLLIKADMALSGMPMRELAKRCGVAPKTLSNFMVGCWRSQPLQRKIEKILKRKYWD